jgi:membrane protease YdiL (CAAX protease family)
MRKGEVTGGPGAVLAGLLLAPRARGDGPESGERGCPARQEQLVEASVFLGLILPSMVLGLFVVRQGGLGFDVVAWATILRDVGLAGLVGFFVWRNGERWKRMGWSLRGWPREVALGAVLFLPVTFGARSVDALLQTAGFSAPATPLPDLVPGPAFGQIALAVFLVATVAVTEETIFRGYLIRRFSAITRSPRAAVVLAAFVFSLGHGYEGTAGVITVGVLGVVLGVVYLWRGSLVAATVIHFLQDLVGIVLPPLVAGS